MSVPRAERIADAVIDEVLGAVVADRRLVETVVTGVLGRGHVLLEDVPTPATNSQTPAVVASAARARSCPLIGRRASASPGVDRNTSPTTRRAPPHSVSSAG